MDGRPWQWGVLRLVTRMRNGGNLTGRIRTVLRGGTVSYRAIAWNAQTGGWTVDGRHARVFFFGEERDEFRTTGQRSNADHRRRQQHRCATSARYHDPMLHVDISKHSRSQPHRILLPRHVLACGNATRTTTTTTTTTEHRFSLPVPWLRRKKMPFPTVSSNPPSSPRTAREKGPF